MWPLYAMTTPRQVTITTPRTWITCSPWSSANAYLASIIRRSAKTTRHHHRCLANARCKRNLHVWTRWVDAWLRSLTRKRRQRSTLHTCRTSGSLPRWHATRTAFSRMPQLTALSRSVTSSSLASQAPASQWLPTACLIDAVRSITASSIRFKRETLQTSKRSSQPWRVRHRRHGRLRRLALQPDECDRGI